LTEKKDLYEKAKGEMRLSERILAELPGFRGYKEKELRRESDRLIRDHLYAKLMKARSDLKEVFQQLSQQRRFEVLTDMDQLVTKYDRVAEKINHASYGYTGFFDVVKVDEEKLDKMIEFDSQLIDEVQTVEDEASAFKKEITKKGFEKAKDHVQETNEALQTLEDTFDQRGEIILGVT
jgi:DNA replication initiation complex subunit (GINS family)